jgi:hypothetical protein
MKKSRLLGVLCAAAFTLVSTFSTAALIDRGSGLLYDDVLNVTWLQDANYAKTSNYSTDGKLYFLNAIAWADQLVYHDSVRNVDYDDWRLASNFDDQWPFHYGWWQLVGDPTPTSGPHTELSYMYYENLGLNGYLDNNGGWDVDYGIHGDSTPGGQNDVGLVLNLQGGEYWSDSNPLLSQQWTFSTNTGNHHRRPDSHFAWAVRDGDIAAVPIPASVWLFGSGLVGLFVIARKKHF